MLTRQVETAKSPRFSLLTVLVLMTFVTGCYSWPQQQEQARELAMQIGDYRAAQKDHIERLNRDYRAKFALLMKNFVELTKVQLQQYRDADAQEVADALVGDRNAATLRGTFRKSFAQTVAAGRDRVAQADLAVAQTRTAYVQAYRDARVELAKLDKVEANLQALGAKENQLQTATQFVQTVIKVHDDLKKEANAKEGKAPTTSGKP